MCKLYELGTSDLQRRRALEGEKFLTWGTFLQWMFSELDHLRPLSRNKKETWHSATYQTSWDEIEMTFSRDCLNCILLLE